MIPSTVDRVPAHTRQDINQRIKEATHRNIEAMRHASVPQIKKRLEELNKEWDIERAIETNASSLILAGLALGTFVNRRFYAIPAIVGGFLLQHGIQGWCPPIPLLRRLGFRTSYEIDEERYALQEFLEKKHH